MIDVKSFCSQNQYENVVFHNAIRLVTDVPWEGIIMAEITEGIQKKIEMIARKYAAGNYDDEQDCLQEGLTKVLEMPNGQTESYYVQYAKNRIANYMKKERAFRSGTTIADGNDLKDYIHVAPWMAGSGDVDTMDIGRQTPQAPNYDTLTEGEDNE